MDSENAEKTFEKYAAMRTLPRQLKKKKEVLSILIRHFKKNKNYTEDDIDAVIKNFFDDYTGVRRELIDLGFMQRNLLGTEYRRIK